MLNRPCTIALASVLALLCIDTAQGQSKVNPKVPPEQPIWISFTGDLLMLGDLTPTIQFSTGEKVEIGDPKLARWAEKASTRLDDLPHLDLHNWFTVVSYYRIQKAESIVVKAAQMLIKRDQEVNDKRSQIFNALSMVASKKSIRHLQGMLEEPVRDVSVVRIKGGRDFGHRPLLAATLFRLGDEKGFDYLVSSFREQLIDQQKGNGGDSMPRVVLSNSYHSELYKRVAALREDPEINTQSHREIDSVLEDMQVVSLSREKLWELIEDTSPKNARRRSHAISALSERGTVEDIPRLAAMHNQIPVNLQTSGARNQLLLTTIMLRCRLWKEAK